MSAPARLACISALYASLALMTAAHAAAPLEHFGMCDASAAIAVGAGHFLVANNDDDTLRLYRNKQSGAPVQEFPFAAWLAVPGQETDGGIDIEGAAQIGKRIYWIASHGASKKGKERNERRQLFATDIGEKNGVVSVTPVGQPYRGLLEAMTDQQQKSLEKYGLRKAAGRIPEKDNGLNIEGLAATPEGHLLIGFRSPLTGDGKALVLPLLNPAQLVPAQGAAAKPTFGEPEELDLDGRGIRSIEYVPRLGAYLIVAGPSGSKGKFNLYKWARPTPPVLLPVDVAGDDLHPEALFALADGKSFQMLSDDGDVKIGKDDCKDFKPAAKRKFRSMVIVP